MRLMTWCKTMIRINFDPNRSSKWAEKSHRWEYSNQMSSQKWTIVNGNEVVNRLNYLPTQGLVGYVNLRSQTLAMSLIHFFDVTLPRSHALALFSAVCDTIFIKCVLSFHMNWTEVQYLLTALLVYSSTINTCIDESQWRAHRLESLNTGLVSDSRIIFYAGSFFSRNIP